MTKPDDSQEERQPVEAGLIDGPIDYDRLRVRIHNQ